MKRSLPHQLTDKLFVLGDNLFLTYLLKGESCTLFDLASSGTVPLIRDQLNYLGIGRHEISHLVVQHAHWDHSCGLPYFKELFPQAVVLGSAKAKEVLGKSKIVDQFRQNDERWCSRLKEMGVLAELPSFLPYQTMPVDRVVQDRETLALGGVPVEFIATPGHSPCSLTVHLPTEKALLVSDSIGFYLPQTDDFLPMFFQGVEQTLDSIAKLKRLDVDILGYGHALDLLLVGRETIARAYKRLEDGTRELTGRIRKQAESGIPEETLLEELCSVCYRDFLAELYLREYLKSVSPFYLKAILSANLSGSGCGAQSR